MRSLPEVVSELSSCSSVSDAIQVWKDKNVESGMEIYNMLADKVKELEENEESAEIQNWFPVYDEDEERNAFSQLCQSGDLDGAKLLLSIGGKELLVTNALADSIEEKHFAIARWLVDTGYDVNTRRSKYTESALSSACKIKSLEMVKLLLDHGARVDISIEDYNRFPIHYVTSDINIIKELVEAGGIGQIFHETNIPESAITDALKANDEEILYYYLEKLEDGFEWNDQIYMGERRLDIDENVSEEIRKRLFIALANAGYFEDDKTFLSSVKHSHLELAQLCEVSQHFPKISFPSAQKSAMNAGEKRSAAESELPESQNQAKASRIH